MNNKWERIAREEWVPLYNEGYTSYTIAQRYKTYHGQVRFWLQKLGVFIKGRDRPQGKLHGLFSGYEKITGKYFSNVKCSARNRGIEFTLTAKDMWEQFQKQEEKCAITGMKLDIFPFYKDLDKQTASLDRIDSSKGYIIGNIQWVHKLVNIMKNSLTHEQFIQICHDVAKLYTEPKVRPDFGGVLKRNRQTRRKIKIEPEKT